MLSVTWARETHALWIEQLTLRVLTVHVPLNFRNPMGHPGSDSVVCSLYAVHILPLIGARITGIHCVCHGMKTTAKKRNTTRPRSACRSRPPHSIRTTYRPELARFFLTDLNLDLESTFHVMLVTYLHAVSIEFLHIHVHASSRPAVWVVLSTQLQVSAWVY